MCQEISIHFAQYVDNKFLIENYINTWNGEFHPIPHEDYWIYPNMYTLLFDPYRERSKQRGRPKSICIQNEMDANQGACKNHCGVCNEEGHDR